MEYIAFKGKNIPIEDIESIYNNCIDDFQKKYYYPTFGFYLSVLLAKGTLKEVINT